MSSRGRGERTVTTYPASFFGEIHEGLTARETDSCPFRYSRNQDGSPWRESAKSRVRQGATIRDGDQAVILRGELVVSKHQITPLLGRAKERRQRHTR